MIKKYKMNNIIPFNEVYYIHCHYNSLFPVLNYFKKSIKLFLINNLFLYTMSSDLLLKFTLKSLNDDNTILDKIGVNVNSINRSKDLVSDIINSLSGNRPVIIVIDSFYNPIILDAYQKKHMYHTILIYGFDIDKKLFNVLELEYLDNHIYKPLTISFDDLIKAYSTDIFKESEILGTYFDYQAVDKETIVKNSADAYIKYMLDNYDLLIKSLIEFERFISILSNLKEREIIIKKDILLTSYIIILNKSKMEYFNYKNIFGNNHAYTDIRINLLDIWSLIVRNFALFSYSNNKSGLLFFKSLELLKRAYDLESEFITNVL